MIVNSEPIDSGKVPDGGSNFDVIVVGGGPGGSASAAYAAMDGCRVLLLEKAVYPRDKTCGDAVGGKSLKHVSELGVKPMIEKMPHNRVTGIIFSSANGQSIQCSLPEEEIENKEAGFALPRKEFDYVMFKRSVELVLENGGSVIQDFTVTDVNVDESDEKKIIGVTGIIGGKKSGNEPLTFTAPLTIGAGGYTCPVAKTITEKCHDEPMRDEVHYCGAYREYWVDVGGCEGEKIPIEIHFIKEVIPGYWWIFPVGVNDEGKTIVNVGIGMVIKEMNKQSVKLKKLQKWVIEEHPVFSKRFKNATMVEGTGKGHQLPFGSPRKNAPSFQPRRSAMAGAICVGDAASLVDPFSGEGVGNALVSSKMAISHFDAEKHKDGFPTSQAEAYMIELWDTLGPELTNSFKMQKMVRKTWLMNWIIKKANKKPAIKDMLEQSLSSKEAQEEMKSTWNLLKLLLF
ncbi:MAG: NAD(P)/FAD-dependent oxidoreductase [Candidatus Poseidoniaceae archaeon]|nr:NAD(P)/FAD-dependent oxidoreductase [Candidatus Poseidoniaceae archaeon]